MTNTNYNGWHNHSTWNVALWIQNDESIYNHALELMRCWREDAYGSLDHFDERSAYEVCTELFPSRSTPDGVKIAYHAPIGSYCLGIAWSEIADMLIELAGENDDPAEDLDEVTNGAD